MMFAFDKNYGLSFINKEIVEHLLNVSLVLPSPKQCLPSANLSTEANIHVNCVLRAEYGYPKGSPNTNS
jgi:hypothetical protein